MSIGKEAGMNLSVIEFPLYRFDVEFRRPQTMRYFRSPEVA
jgi:hypothetical protein